MTRGRIIAAIVALVVVGGIVVGVVAGARSGLPEVGVAKATKETLGVIVTASGKLEADQRADVFPPTAGTIDSVEVTEGAEVKAGQVIAVLDTDPIRLQIAQARAGVAGAAAQYDAAGKTVPTTQDWTAASAAVTAAKSGYDVAKSAYDFMKAAYDATTTIGKASMEASLTSTRIAKEQAYAGYTQTLSAHSKLPIAAAVAAARNAASAQRSQSEEALRQANEMLDRSTLTSPIDGVVVFNALGAPGADGATPKAAVGAPVSPAGPPFSVVQLGALSFSAQVDEADIDRVRSGMAAKVRLDAFPSDDLAATVGTIRPVAVQTTTGGIAFPVLLNLSAPGKTLRVGMSGSVDIEVSAVPDAISVPIEAILDESGKKFVFVVSGEKVTKREVTTGALTDTRAQILKGLDEGETVATTGLSNLKDGAAVRLKQ